MTTSNFSTLFRIFSLAFSSSQCLPNMSVDAPASRRVGLPVGSRLDGSIDLCSYNSQHSTLPTKSRDGPRIEGRVSNTIIPLYSPSASPPRPIHRLIFSLTNSSKSHSPSSNSRLDAIHTYVSHSTSVPNSSSFG